jgi:hypothetical protein
MKNSTLSPVQPSYWTPHVTLYDAMNLMKDSEFDVDFTNNLACLILGNDEFV